MPYSLIYLEIPDNSTKITNNEAYPDNFYKKRDGFDDIDEFYRQKEENEWEDMDSNRYDEDLYQELALDQIEEDIAQEIQRDILSNQKDYDAYLDRIHGGEGFADQDSNDGERRENEEDIDEYELEYYKEEDDS